jgi:hypothetical protein
MSRPGSRTENELPVEDDWFASPEDEAYTSYEDVEPYEEEVAPQREARSPAGDNRPLLILGGIAAVVVLIIAGILIARAVSGSDDEGTATVPTIATPPAATPPATPPPATTTEPVSPPATPPAATVTVPEGVTLRPGDTGDSVEELQAALVQLGYDPGPVDGDYGGATTQAVASFQQAAGITTDGVAGPETLSALSQALSQG